MFGGYQPQPSPIEWNTFAKPLPLEVYTLIAAHLTKRELAICVRISKEWNENFGPCLWKTVDISFPLIYHRFAASIKEGSLTRNGTYIKSLSTSFYSIVDLLESYGKTCTNLIELQVHSGDDPFVPQPAGPLVQSGRNGGFFAFNTGFSHNSGFGAAFGNNVSTNPPSTEATNSNRQHSHGTTVLGSATSQNSVATTQPSVVTNGLSVSVSQSISVTTINETADAGTSGAGAVNAIGSIPVGGFGITQASLSVTPAGLVEPTTSTTMTATGWGATTTFQFPGTQFASNPFVFNRPPPPKPLVLVNLIHLIRKNPALKKLSIHGRTFHEQKCSSITRLFQALPRTVENLIIGGFNSVMHHQFEGTIAESIDEDNSTVGEKDDDSKNDADREDETPLNVRRIEFQCPMIDKRVLFPLLKRCPLLETLVCNRFEGTANQELSSILREHCPQLNDLLVDRGPWSGNDKNLSHLIEASARGWRSVDLNCPGGVGSLSEAALLKHAPSLETLRVRHCSGLTSPVIQELLCSAPNLKRLEALSMFSYGSSALSLDAQDIIRSRWVCDKLEVLGIKITGIPRPDLKVRTNGRPLSGPLHEGHIEDSYLIQRRIYSQLGAMTNLTDLVLGSDADEDVGNHELQIEEEENEGEYYQTGPTQIWQQYECLSFTLESGMNRLQNLKKLRRIHLQGLSVGFDGAPEQEWVKVNWPALKYSYGNWNGDGHGRCNGGDEGYEDWI